MSKNFAILYAGSYTEQYFSLMKKCSQEKIPFGIVSYTGLWRQNLDLLPFDKVHIYYYDGTSEEYFPKNKYSDRDVIRNVVLFFNTSGSTKGFKWVFLSQDSLQYVTSTLKKHLNITKKDKLAVIPPAFHCFGTVLGILLSKNAKCDVSFMERYDAKAWVEKIAYDKCTHVLAVPTIIHDLLREGPRNLLSLRGGIIGGAPVARKLFLDAKYALGLPELTIGYGLTECAPAVTHTKLGYEPQFDHEIGEPLPGTMISFDMNGEALVNGPQQCVATSSDKGLEKTTIVHTGDFLKKISNKWIFSGRSIETLNQGGEKLTFLEADLHFQKEFPRAEILCFAIPDERLGEVLGIAVAGTFPSDVEIQKSVEKKFGKFFSSCRVHRVVELPRLPSGKVTRNYEEIYKKKIGA